MLRRKAQLWHGSNKCEDAVELRYYPNRFRILPAKPRNCPGERRPVRAVTSPNSSRHWGRTLALPARGPSPAMARSNAGRKLPRCSSGHRSILITRYHTMPPGGLKRPETVRSSISRWLCPMAATPLQGCMSTPLHDLAIRRKHSGGGVPCETTKIAPPARPPRMS